MPISGLVVSLSDQAELREQAVRAIEQEPRIEVGALASHRLAIVVDTASSEQDKELWHWLTSLPGVLFVEVAMVGFEATAAAPTPPTHPPLPTHKET